MQPLTANLTNQMMLLQRSIGSSAAPSLTSMSAAEPESPALLGNMNTSLSSALPTNFGANPNNTSFLQNLGVDPTGATPGLLSQPGATFGTVLPFATNAVTGTQLYNQFLNNQLLLGQASSPFSLSGSQSVPSSGFFDPVSGFSLGAGSMDFASSFNLTDILTKLVQALKGQTGATQAVGQQAGAGPVAGTQVTGANGQQLVLVPAGAQAGTDPAEAAAARAKAEAAAAAATPADKPKAPVPPPVKKPVVAQPPTKATIPQADIDAGKARQLQAENEQKANAAAAAAKAKADADRARVEQQARDSEAAKGPLEQAANKSQAGSFITGIAKGLDTAGKNASDIFHSWFG